jgi:PiT family inorganic phosphate transporter
LIPFSHGSNDVQKTMGGIALALLSTARMEEFHVSLWVQLASAARMGSARSGGEAHPPHARDEARQAPAHRRLRRRDRRLRNPSHDGAQGFPVSTTHVVTTSMMAVGATRRLSAVRRGVASTPRRLAIDASDGSGVAIIAYRLIWAL